MGRLIDGVWQIETEADRIARNRKTFNRPDSGFRSWVTADGNPGPSGECGFKAEPGRYHLYICWACPWAHRTMIVRKLKGLEDAISYSVTNWFMGEMGWSFAEGDGVIADPIWGVEYLHQLYARVDPTYTGRVSVPVLFDRERETIVSNESSEIIRMFNSAFNAFAANSDLYLYPEPLRAEIDAINARVYDTVNNGVYKSGFAGEQAAYDAAVTALFDTFDFLEARLAGQRYLVGEAPTEADWRLFATLVRFDRVYNGHFKCNIRRLVDYPNLWAYTRDLYQMPGIAETCEHSHIQHHYYASHESINPARIVPRGPVVDFDTPHGRAELAAAA